MWTQGYQLFSDMIDSRSIIYNSLLCGCLLKSNTFTLILSHYLFSSIIDIFDNVFVLFCQFPIFHHFLYPTQWRLRNSSCVFLWVHQLMETVLREFISESYTKNISLAINIPPNRFEFRATVIIRVTTTTHLSVWCDRG